MPHRSTIREYRYRPAWWLRGGHAQTLWGRFARRPVPVATSVEYLTTPDGDTVEVHHVTAAPNAPRVLFLHGLEGSSRSHYVAGAFHQASTRGWGASLMVFRGCGTQPNVARRFYHSGETGDPAFVFDRLAARWPNSAWFLLGVSLGGNVLLKWLGELGDHVDPRIRAAAAISVPFDLEAGARHISRGFARVYDANFLRSLRQKALAKLTRYPDLFDRSALERARSVYDFDEVVTGPVHGFANARDYYERSSSQRYLAQIRIPTLLLSSRDDPFLPPDVLERVQRIVDGNPSLTAEFHRGGGHVGFVAGRWPWRPFYYAEWRAFRYFEEMVEPR